MTPEDLDAYVELNNKKASSLTRYWQHKLPSILAPSSEQFLRWLAMFDHNFDVVLFGIDETAGKCLRLNGKMSPEHAIRFCSACCIRFHKTGVRKNVPADKVVQRESYEVRA